MECTYMTQRGLRTILLTIFLAAFAHSAFASSSAAWQELYRKTGNACLQASGLQHAKLVGEPVTFAHAVLYRINGVWPQAHMKGQKAKLYCLHPYPDGAPEIVERH